MTPQEEEQIKHVVENTESIEQLTKSIKKLKKSFDKGGGGSGSGEGDGSSGPVGKGLTKAVDGIKKAFSNNKTVQFITDPVGTLGKGISGSLNSFKSLLPDFSNFGDKIGKIFGGGGAGISKEQYEGLRTELSTMVEVLRNQSTFTQDDTNYNNLVTALDKVENAIAGVELSPTDTADLRRDIDDILDNLTMPEVNTPNLRELSQTAQPQEGILGTQINTEPTAPGGTLNNPSLNLSEDSIESQAEGIGDSIVKAMKGDDQLKREQERDRILREDERQEGLLNALGNMKSKLTLEGGKGSKDKTGLFGFLSNIVDNKGLEAGTMGVGIATFIRTVGGAVASLGPMLPAIAAGSGGVFLMLASLSPLVAAMYAFGSMDSPFKAMGALATGLIGLGAAVGILGGIMMSGVGVAVLGAGTTALFALGASLIPLAAAFALASIGMDDFATFLERVGAVGVKNLAGAATGLAAIGVSLAAFSAGSLISFFTPGKNGLIKSMERMADTGDGINKASTALRGMKQRLLDIKGINFDSGGVEDFFEKLYKVTDKRDFKKRIKDAGDAIAGMLSTIKPKLDELDLDKLSALDNVMQVNINPVSAAATGADMEYLNIANADMIRVQTAGGASIGEAGGTVINRGGDTVNNVTNISNPKFVDEQSVNYLFGGGAFGSTNKYA